MIPGNIDLTENLDFRNVKIKQLPAMPDSWGSSKKDLSKYIGNINNIGEFNNIDTTFTFDYVNDIFTYYNYDDTYTTYRTYSLTNNDLSWYSYGNDYIINDITIYRNIEENDELTYDISFEYNDNTKEDNGIFSKVNRDIKIKRKICWNNNNNNNTIKSIAWEDNRFKNHLFRDTDTNIPWINKYELGSIYFTKKKSISNAICYLKDKSISFIKNYLNKLNDQDEDVDLSYLTNMNWLRVNDVTIDI